MPVDFSDCSLDGLNHAIAFADRVAAKLILFHAIQLAPYTSDGFAYDLSSLEEVAQKDAERQMREFVRMAKFGRVKFETAIIMGPPTQEIYTFAQNHNVDLIITSTHGRTGLSHVLIGRVAESIVRHASCSVLVVPSHPQQRAKNLTSRAGRTRKLPRSKGRQTAAKQMLHGTRRLTRRLGKIAAYPVEERRKTNKFRESHSA